MNDSKDINFKRDLTKFKEYLGVLWNFEQARSPERLKKAGNSMTEEEWKGKKIDWFSCLEESARADVLDDYGNKVEQLQAVGKRVRMIDANKKDKGR